MPRTSGWRLWRPPGKDLTVSDEHLCVVQLSCSEHLYIASFRHGPDGLVSLLFYNSSTAAIAAAVAPALLAERTSTPLPYTPANDNNNYYYADTPK